MPRPPAQHFGFSPGGDLAELRAVDELFERLLGFPLAEDDIGADARDVLVHVRLDMAGESLEMLEHLEESLLELLFLARHDVVVHPDGGHEPTIAGPSPKTPAHRYRP